MEIETLDGEKLVSYGVYFIDIRTVIKEYAGYDISLYPSELEKKLKSYNSGKFVKCELKEVKENG